MREKDPTCQYCVLELNKDDKDYVPDLIKVAEDRAEDIEESFKRNVKFCKEIIKKYKSKYENYNELFGDSYIVNKLY